MPTSPAAEPENLPIHTRGLTKRYGATVALDGLDLDVRAGEAELFGLDAFVRPVAAHRRLAYVSGEPGLWPALTGEETFELLGALHEGTDVAYRRELALPVGRARWLASRLSLAAAAAGAISLTAAISIWAGAQAAGVSVSVCSSRPSCGSCSVRCSARRRGWSISLRSSISGWPGAGVSSRIRRGDRAHRGRRGGDCLRTVRPSGSRVGRVTSLDTDNHHRREQEP